MFPLSILSFPLFILSYPYGKSFIADSVPSVLSPLPPGAPLRNLYVHYIKPLFAPCPPMLSPGWFPFSSAYVHLCGENAYILL